MIKNWEKMRRNICLTLTASMVLCMVQPAHRTDAASVLTLEEAVEIGITNSKEIYDLRMEDFKKRIELYQAREALFDMRLKERTFSWSPLLNIKLPEQHGQPKEINTVFKIPELMDEIENVKKKLTDAERLTVMNVKTQYLSVVSEMLNMRSYKQRLSEERDSLNYLRLRALIGQALPDTVKSKEKDVKNVEKNYQNAVLAFEREKKSLSELIGIDVTTNYRFDERLIYLSLNREDFNKILTHSKANNLDIYLANRALVMAETKTELYLADIKNNFGWRAAGVEAVLRRPGEVNFDALYDEYEKMLEKVEDIWKGYFYIPLLFIVIPIPKKWVQGQWAGERYWDNEKFGLPISVIEREKARKDLAKITRDHDTKIEKLYLDLKIAQINFDNAKKLSDQAVSDLKAALKKNKTGAMTFEDYEQVKNSTRSILDSCLSNLISYNKMLIMFDYETSGAISRRMTKMNVDLAMLENGESFVENEGDESGQEGKEESLPGEWYITYVGDGAKIGFGIKKLPEGIEATHFELYTYDGLRVGERTSVNEQLKHLPVVMSESSLFKVVLYNNDTRVGEAQIDGFETGGILKLIESNDTLKQYTGKWKLEAGGDSLKSVFSIKVDDELGAVSYEIENEGVIIQAKTDIKTKVEHLNMIFADMKQFRIKFYNSDNKHFASAVIVRETDDKLEEDLDITIEPLTVQSGDNGGENPADDWEGDDIE